jgi:ATP-dependent DNA helicase RecG
MENKQLSIFDTFEIPVFSALGHAFPDSESDEIEYKSAEGGFPRDMWKTYSAFANSKGGVIILGIKERRGNFTIEGLTPDQIDSYKKEFWSNANNKNTVSINLLTDYDVKDFVVDAKTVLAFRIPSASRTSRPVFLTRNPFDNTYKRNHEGDYKCTQEEVRRMLADADLTVHPDSRILEGYSLDDFDLQSMRQYRQLFASTRPGHPWLSFDDTEFLTQLGAFRKDRKTKKEGATVAGILMFGKTNSITDEECCPNFFPDYREILTTDTEIRWTDRIYPDGNWEANLFQFYRMVWPKLASSLPKPFQLKDGVRQDETPAHTALREAFVNALIHCDYSAPNNIVIEQRIDNYKFSNPGTLLVTLRQYYQGGTSECRNTSLQKMFLMIGSAEKAGSGVNKIMSGWESAHWGSPFLTIDSQPDRLILELPKFSILPDETLQTLRVLFGDNVDSLGKDELTILAICHIEGEITNNRLQYMIDKHRSDITKILQELCKDGYLLSENKSRWTTYHLNTDFLVSKYEQVAPNLDTPDTNLGTPDTNLDTPNTNLDTSNLDTSGANLVSSNLDTSIPVTAENIPKKLSKEKLYSIIREICESDFFSAEDIATKVDRSVDYLKNDIIPTMIEKGLLVRLYPDTINHPNQKFKTSNEIKI